VALKFLKGEAKEEPLVKKPAAPSATPEAINLSQPMAFDVEVDGEAYLVKVAPAGMTIQEAQPKAPTDGVTVPMQGVVIRYNVKKGDKVAKGDAVAVLEAMKMENNVLANKDGMIKEIYVKEGTTVTPGDVLMSID
jgi:pyruvate carboxylase subunit B